jgi:hypothetical protein
MGVDTFGNLLDWGQVLESLEDLKRAKKLEDHQAGLARILRYGQNWRLLEAVHEHGKEVVAPSGEFLKAICDVMNNRGIYVDARVLAVQTLETLVPRMTGDRKGDGGVSRNSVIQAMKALQKSIEPPKFQEAIAQSLKVIS